MNTAPRPEHPILHLSLRITYLVVIGSMLFAIGLGIYRANTEMIVYAITTIAILPFPRLLRRFAHIDIPPLLELLCILFVFASITLAKLFDFYTLIPAWDLILHCASGPLLSAIGIATLGLWRFDGKGPAVLAPLFIAMFGFFFSTAFAALWEFYEFGFDALTGGQMQKYEYYRGVLDTGLFDTMSDMLVATAGSFVYAGITWLDLKYWGGRLTKRLYLTHRKAPSRRELAP